LASLERRKCGRAPALYMQSEEAAKRSRPLRNTLRSRRCAQTRYDSGTCMEEWERRLSSHDAGRKQQKFTEGDPDPDSACEVANVSGKTR
jgi:hypothetical protein